MVNLKASQCIKDTHIVKHVMSDCGYQNVNCANARFEIMMKLLKLLVENGVGDGLFAL